MKVQYNISGLDKVQSEYSRLINRIHESINNIVLILCGIPIMGGGVFLFLVSYSSIITGSFEPLFQFGLFGLLLAILWMLFMLLIAPFLVYYITKKITEFLSNIITLPFRKFISKLRSKLNELSDNIEKDIYETQNIGEILLKLGEIQRLLSVIRIIRKISFLQKKVHYQSKVTLYSTTKWIIRILSDLRSDLQIRLTEQQQILKSAKSEVTENIQGTTELAQVSELQKMRLDKQIEQFEELQRVLVKA